MINNTNKDNFDYVFRIIILGDSCVGKTSVVLRYVEDTFKEEHTIISGNNIHKKILQTNNKLVQLKILDKINTSERFATLPRNYYKNIEGAIIVYDNNIYNFYKPYDYIKKTIEEIKSSVNLDTKIILFKNKCDLDDDSEIEEKVKKLADEYGIKHFEVSAKTGNNINKGFDSLINDILALQNILEKSKSNNISLKSNDDINKANKKCAK